jgi:hypothetical protein
VLQLVAAQPVQELPPPAEAAVSLVPTLALQALINLSQLGLLHFGHSTAGSPPNTSFSKSSPQSLQ